MAGSIMIIVEIAAIVFIVLALEWRWRQWRWTQDRRHKIVRGIRHRVKRSR